MVYVGFLFNIIIILMQPGRTKGAGAKKSPDLLQNPELTTAQMTLSRTTPVKSSPTTPPIDPREVLEQADQLWQ